MQFKRKRELIKNVVLMTMILSIAIISTYYIYNKFDNSEVVDYTSESLDITYKEEAGDKISITTVSPVTDSVGLSSKAHTVTIKNNLTEKVNYKIRINDDVKTMIEDDCTEYQIPKQDIRVSVRDASGNNAIYTLSDLENNILVSHKIDVLKEEKYTIRLWVSSESSLPMGSDIHYHGIIEVVEESE